MDAIEVLAQGSMKAAALHLHAGAYPNLKRRADIKHELITQWLRNELKANLQRYMAEWKNAIDAHMGEAMLQTIVNAQCNEVAMRALKQAELEA